MGFMIEDAKGTGQSASVDNHGGKGRLDVSSRSGERIMYQARDGDAYTVTATDTAPAAGEYTLYIQNTGDTERLHIHSISFSANDADVRWKVHSVTGTAGGASVITPVNLNLGSGKSAPATCRGGAGGVTGLTSQGVIYNLFHGEGNTTHHHDTHDALILQQNDAIAIEYDAGTGGAVAITVDMHFDETD